MDCFYDFSSLGVCARLALADNCSIVQPFSNYPCAIANGSSNSPTSKGEGFSFASRCLRSSLAGGPGALRNIPFGCYPRACAANFQVVTVGMGANLFTEVVCQDGAVRAVEGFGGNLTCVPPASIPTFCLAVPFAAILNSTAAALSLNPPPIVASVASKALGVSWTHFLSLSLIFFFL